MGKRRRPYAVGARGTRGGSDPKVKHVTTAIERIHVDSRSGFSSQSTSGFDFAFATVLGTRNCQKALVRVIRNKVSKDHLDLFRDTAISSDQPTLRAVFSSTAVSWASRILPSCPYTPIFPLGSVIGEYVWWLGNTGGPMHRLANNRRRCYGKGNRNRPGNH